MHQGFSKVNVFLFSVRLRRTRLGMWKILARHRRAKIFHIPKKKARLRAEPDKVTLLRSPVHARLGLPILGIFTTINVKQSILP